MTSNWRRWDVVISHRSRSDVVLLLRISRYSSPSPSCWPKPGAAKNSVKYWIISIHAGKNSFIYYCDAHGKKLVYSYLYRNKKYSLLMCRKRPMPLGIDVSLQNIPWTDWSYGLSVRGMFCLVYISIEVGLERKACCMELWDPASQGMELPRHCY